MIIIRDKKVKQILLCISIVMTTFVFCMYAQAISKEMEDHLGRTVNVPDNPNRVVSLSPSITEIVYSIDQGGMLVGATTYSDYPEKAKSLPRVGSYVRLDLEKIIALKPDLCLSIKDGNPKELIERLISMGIPVFVLEAKHVNSVIKTIGDMGRIFNANDKARALTDDMNHRINKIKVIVDKSSQKPGLFYQIGLSPVVSAGTDSVINGLIEIAGGDNLAKGSIAYPRYSKEQVIALAPDVFIISSMAVDGNFDKVRAEWSSWTQIPAVKNNRIYLIDSSIVDRPGPRMVQGIELLARLIHPELFTD